MPLAANVSASRATSAKLAPTRSTSAAATRSSAAVTPTGAPNADSAPIVRTSRYEKDVIHELTSSPATPPRSPPRAAHTSTLFVAIHALEHGRVVYARAGRMGATERETLRKSIHALLAEHGLSADSICIDGADAVGDNRWR